MQNDSGAELRLDENRTERNFRLSKAKECEAESGVGGRGCLSVN